MTSLITKQQLEQASRDANRLDIETNKDLDFYVDENGKHRITNYGRNKQFQQFLLNSGYEFIGDYENGPFTLTALNQVIRYNNELWGINASTNPPFTTTGTDSISWASDVNHLVSRGDGVLRQDLASNSSGKGASIVITEQGDSVQDGIYYITLQGQGGKADFNPTTQNTSTATDNFAYIKASVAKAMSTGRKEVVIPSGNYYVKLTDLLNDINLGGDGYYGTDGVLLRGAGKQKTVLWVDAQSSENILFSMRGGSGSVSSKSLRSMTIRTITANRWKGNFLVVENACFSTIDDIDFISGNTQLTLRNGVSAGGFTEFNRINNCRFNAGMIDILFEVNGGDNSFHGISITNSQVQIKTTDGKGIKCNGITAPVYLYNQHWDLSFFGGSGCVAMEFTNTNTDNIYGNLTHEGAMICRTTDNSSFEFKGNFAGIGSVTYSIATPTTVKAANIVFDNVLDNTDAFSNSSLSAFTPRVFNPQLADTMDNGVPASLWRIGNSAGNGLLFNAVIGSPGWFFTTTDPLKRLQQAVPKYRLSPDGNSITAYTSTLYLNTSNSNFGIQLSESPAMLSPRTDNTSSCGNGSYRWTQVFATNSTIATSNKTKKRGFRNSTDIENDAFYEIGLLPNVWQWLEKYEVEGDNARLHSGPTVQDAIEIMTKYGLDWSSYSCFCYNKWERKEAVYETWDDEYTTIPYQPASYDDVTGELLHEAIPEYKILTKKAGKMLVSPELEAGEDYSFRKEELLFWILRATISKQKTILERLSNLENKI